MQLQTRRTLLATVAALASGPARAADIDLGAGKLVLKGSITAGAEFRTQSRDTDLLPNVNSSLIGITGTASTPDAGRNQDDGNLNFANGDAVSQVLNAYDQGLQIAFLGLAAALPDIQRLADLTVSAFQETTATGASAETVSESSATPGRVRERKTAARSSS